MQNSSTHSPEEGGTEGTKVSERSEEAGDSALPPRRNIDSPDTAVLFGETCFSYGSDAPSQPRQHTTKVPRRARKTRSDSDSQDEVEEETAGHEGEKTRVRGKKGSKP